MDTSHLLSAPSALLSHSCADTPGRGWGVVGGGGRVFPLEGAAGSFPPTWNGRGERFAHCGPWHGPPNESRKRAGMTPAYGAGFKKGGEYRAFPGASRLHAAKKNRLWDYPGRLTGLREVARQKVNLRKTQPLGVTDCVYKQVVLSDSLDEGVEAAQEQPHRVIQAAYAEGHVICVRHAAGHVNGGEICWQGD